MIPSHVSQDYRVFSDIQVTSPDSQIYACLFLYTSLNTGSERSRSKGKALICKTGPSRIWQRDNNKAHNSQNSRNMFRHTYFLATLKEDSRGKEFSVTKTKGCACYFQFINLGQIAGLIFMLNC